MNRAIVFVIALGASTLSVASDNLIPYKVINRSEMAHYKVSFDVEVPLVGNRLPNKQELGEISKHLISNERKHDRSFVLFFLPGMNLDSGAYATAHHTPEMEVNVMKYMLIQYPKYKQYAQ